MTGKGNKLNVIFSNYYLKFNSLKATIGIKNCDLVCSLSTYNISLTKANFVWISSETQTTIFTESIALAASDNVYSYSSTLSALKISPNINNNVFEFSREIWSL